MTDRTNELASLFTARVTEEGGRYRVSIPKRVVERGRISHGDPLRVALIDGTESDRSRPSYRQNAPTDDSSSTESSTGTHAEATTGDATATTGGPTPRGSVTVPTTAAAATESSDSDSTQNDTDATATTQSDADATATTQDDPDGPPVTEGERRTVTIEALGDEGDGIAKVERGYVVIVAGAEPGDTVTVEITNVRENVSFGSIVSV